MPVCMCVTCECMGENVFVLRKNVNVLHQCVCVCVCGGGGGGGLCVSVYVT